MVLLSLLFLATSIITPTYAAKGCESAQADAVRNIRFRIQYSPSTMDSAAMSGWSGGGGDHGKVPSGAVNFPESNGSPLNNTFAGREFGGGGRGTIYGTREYGSGYPYGAGGANPSSSITGRPFPYGVWPISWGANYLGGGEFYGDDVDLIRPGGPVGVVKVGTTDTTKWPGVGVDEVYEMIGDKESLAFMMADLVDWCHATPQWPRRFDPATSATTGTPRPENVIQYYRASSFAIAYSGYNSSSTAPPTTGYSFDNSAPLPSSLVASSFLHCINETIGIALPIMDAYNPAGEKKLSGGEIAGIVFGCVGGVMLLYIVGMKLWWMWEERKEEERRAKFTAKEPDETEASGELERVEQGKEENGEEERAVHL